MDTSQLVKNILKDPHRFTKTQVPCHLRCLLEVAQEETPRVVKHRVLVSKRQRLLETA
jgi:hypothetical protein